jgi:hypothetical protein
VADVKRVRRLITDTTAGVAQLDGVTDKDEDGGAIVVIGLCSSDCARSGFENCTPPTDFSTAVDDNDDELTVEGIPVNLQDIKFNNRDVSIIDDSTFDTSQPLSLDAAADTPYVSLDRSPEELLEALYHTKPCADLTTPAGLGTSSSLTCAPMSDYISEDSNDEASDSTAHIGMNGDEVLPVDKGNGGGPTSPDTVIGEASDADKPAEVVSPAVCAAYDGAGDDHSGTAGVCLDPAKAGDSVEFSD